MSLGERFPLSAALLVGLIAGVAFAAITTLVFAPSAVAAASAASVNAAAAADEDEDEDEDEVECIEREGDEEEAEGEFCGADLGINSDDDEFVLQTGKTFKIEVDLENYAFVGAEDWTFSLVDRGKVELLSLVSDASGVGCRVAGRQGSCGSGRLEPEAGMHLTATYRAVSPGITSVEATVDHAGIEPDDSDNSLEWSVRVTAPKVAAVQCVVPRLKGLKLKAAKVKLKKANCKAGKVKGGGKLKGRALNRLKVVSSRPAPGKKLKRGAKVTLVVKKKR